MSQPDGPAQLVAQVADAVCSVPGVAGLHAGIFGEVGTYLPGETVPGIRIGEDTTAVHLVITGELPVRRVASAVQEVVGKLVSGPVDVIVEDIQPSPSIDSPHADAS